MVSLGMRAWGRASEPVGLGRVKTRAVGRGARTRDLVAGEDDGGRLPRHVLADLLADEEAQVAAEARHEAGARRDAVGIKFRVLIDDLAAPHRLGAQLVALARGAEAAIGDLLHVYTESGELSHYRVSGATSGRVLIDAPAPAPGSSTYGPEVGLVGATIVNASRQLVVLLEGSQTTHRSQ